MKLKAFSIVILLFLTLIISIGAIAADDVADVNDAPSNTSTASTNTSTTTDSPKTTTSTTVKKVDTKVSADQVANEYKKSRYFKVKVKDKNGHVVKNIKIKFNN